MNLFQSQCPTFFWTSISPDQRISQLRSKFKTFGNSWQSAAGSNFQASPIKFSPDSIKLRQDAKFFHIIPFRGTPRSLWQYCGSESDYRQQQSQQFQPGV